MMDLKGLNILYHHRTRGKGVEGVHIREMVHAWKMQGHNVDIIGPPGVLIWDRERQKAERFFDRIYIWISRYIPEIFFEFFEILYNYRSGKKLKKAFHDKNYDLLYERYALFNWSGIREARKAGIPVILEVNYTSHTPLYRKRSKILRFLAARIEGWVFKKADGIVAVSTYLRDHLIQLAIVKKKIIVLTNAADPEVFVPGNSAVTVRESYKLKGRVIVGFVGGFYPWHGLDLLLESFRTVNARYRDIVLVLVGDGPMRPYLEGKVNKMKLEDCVYFTGAVPHSSLPEYISAFDIAVMPNSNEYGSPMKIYEYMAMEKPVIAPRFGPLEDGVTDGIEGLLFEPGNIDELSNCLMKLIENVPLRERIGRFGRKRIIAKHNWQNNAESVVRLFKFLKTKKDKFGKENIYSREGVTF